MSFLHSEELLLLGLPRRIAKEVERRAQEAEKRVEEAQRLLGESQRRTENKFQAVHEHMLNFMAQFRGQSMIDLLVRGVRDMGGLGDMGGAVGMGDMLGVERMRGM